MEEYLRTKESLITNINGELLLGNRMNTFILFHPFAEVIVIFVELLYNVRTNITKSLLEKTVTYKMICRQLKRYFSHMSID